MKELPTDDPLFGKGSIRADGRKIHDMYLCEVKKPEESKGPWDYYKLVATIPADQAFRPLDQGGCPLVRVARAKLTGAGDLRGDDGAARCSAQALFGQLLIGLINGSFYALLSWAWPSSSACSTSSTSPTAPSTCWAPSWRWIAARVAGIGYWWALLLAPLMVGLLGVLLERAMLSGSTSSTTSTACCSPSASR